MSRYVKNKDLTVEFIVLRAFRLGAMQVYQDTRHEYHRQIVTVWPNHEVIAFPMEDWFLDGWNMNFAHNLRSLRRSIENIGIYHKQEATYSPSISAQALRDLRAERGIE